MPRTDEQMFSPQNAYGNKPHPLIIFFYYFYFMPGPNPLPYMVTMFSQNSWDDWRQKSRIIKIRVKFVEVSGFVFGFFWNNTTWFKKKETVVGQYKYFLLPNRFYCLNKKGRVLNCPYVDNSYKWAGGGFLSTVGDLLVFGNALLYSYQVAQLKDTERLLPGFLKPQTSIDLWAPVDRTAASWDKDGLYGQGWMVVEKLQKHGQCRKRRHYVSHTGGAVGASSVLLVLPSEETDQRRGQIPILPQGVVVTIITNMQSVGLNSTALKIAHEFDRARCL